MKVVYAGFSKCGTKTMREAFRILGLEVYDGVENYLFLGNEWNRIFEVGGTKEDFYRMFKDVDAVTDIPSYFFWEEIAEAFPDCKLVFKQRESTEVWWRSMKAQIRAYDVFFFRCMSSVSPSSLFFDSWFRKMVWATFHTDFYHPLFGSTPCNETAMKKAYNRHNTYFVKNAPKERTLFIDFEEGWEPLCKLLDLPVPDVPFPHKNKGATILNEACVEDQFYRKMMNETYFVGAVIVSAGVYTAYKLARKFV